MTTFQCIPMDTETAERFRRTGVDYNGNTLRRVAVGTVQGSNFPCRHCLRSGTPGQVMLLAGGLFYLLDNPNF